MQLELIHEDKDVGYSFLGARTTLKWMRIGYTCPKDMKSLELIRVFLSKKTDLSKLIGFYGAAEDDVSFWKVFSPSLKDIIYADSKYIEDYEPPDEKYFDPYFRMEPLYRKGIKTLIYDHDQPLPGDVKFDILRLQETDVTDEQLSNYLKALSTGGFVITNGYELRFWKGTLEKGILVPLLVHNMELLEFQKYVGGPGGDGFSIEKERKIIGEKNLTEYFRNPISAADMVLLQKS